MYYTPLPSNGFQLDAQETNRTYLFVTSLDTQQDRAKQSFDYGKSKINKTVLSRTFHTDYDQIMREFSRLITFCNILSNFFL